MGRLTFFFSLTHLLIFQACITKLETVGEAVIYKLNNKQQKASHFLKWGGQYEFRVNTINNKTICVNRLLFYKNNLVLCILGYSNDSLAEVNHLIKYGQYQTNVNKWGVYSIDSDTIKAIIYWCFNRNHSNLYIDKACYYSGIITTGDSIINWRMIPPYPEYNRTYNPDYTSFETIPQTLHYIKFPAKLMVDSNKVWLNKYRVQSK
jgi:hypothetical protein